MRTLAPLAAVTLIATLLGGASADAPGRLIDAPEDYTFGCTLAQARPVAIRAFRDNPSAYLRQCVRIEGITDGGRDVLADITDYYRHMNELLAANITGLGMGLYTSKLTQGSITGERQRVEVIGRAFSCDEVAREAEAGIKEKYGDTPMPPPFLTGYCHYYGNAIVYAAFVRVLDPGPLRLTGAEAAIAVGNLDDLKPNDPRYGDVWERATQWFDAVRRDSSPQHNDFIGDCGSMPQPTLEGTAIMRECRAARQNQLGFLGRGALPPIRFFVARGMRIFKATNPDYYYALGCACRAVNCDGQ